MQMRKDDEALNITTLAGSPHVLFVTKRMLIHSEAKISATKPPAQSSSGEASPVRFKGLRLSPNLRGTAASVEKGSTVPSQPDQELSDAEKGLLAFKDVKIKPCCMILTLL